MDEMIEKVKNGYNINIYKDKLELSTAVFKFIESHIVHTLKKKDRFKFCVSGCLLYTSPSPRDAESSRMPSSA